MRLVELDPRWLLKDGRRVGFIFISPSPRERHDGTVSPTPWRQTCFFEATAFRDQERAVHAAMQDHADKYGEFDHWQPCNEIAWTVQGDAGAATFETLTVTPSIDGSAGGLWHGFVTNGEIL